MKTLSVAQNLDLKIVHGDAGFNYDDGEFTVDIENNDAI